MSAVPNHPRIAQVWTFSPRKNKHRLNVVTRYPCGHIGRASAWGDTQLECSERVTRQLANLTDKHRDHPKADK